MRRHSNIEGTENLRVAKWVRLCGLAEYPAHERVDVFPLRVEGEDVLVDIE